MICVLLLAAKFQFPTNMDESYQIMAFSSVSPYRSLLSVFLSLSV
jgi:hypothetical protein